MFSSVLCEMSEKAVFALSAGIAIAVVALGGAIAMALTVIKGLDGITKQPEADGKIRTTMILGLVFIETAIIYALIIAILVAINILG